MTITPYFDYAQKSFSTKFKQCSLYLSRKHQHLHRSKQEDTESTDINWEDTVFAI